MAWVNWSRKSTPEKPPAGQPLGLDLNANRARVALLPGARNRLLVLDEPHTDLPLAINLEKRTPEVGRSALQVNRKFPHLICQHYLPLLGQTREWQAGRHRLDTSSAIALALDKLRTLLAGYDYITLAVPPYLKVGQVHLLTTISSKLRLGFLGSVSTSLAIAADRAERLLNNHPEDPGSENNWVVPLAKATASQSTATVLIVEADEHALSASAVRVDRTQVRLLSTASWPRLGERLWKEAILDGLCDRCIRLCRRDPRDSAEAEQEIYLQIEEAMDRNRAGQPVNLSIRAFHWYQDIEHQPGEFDNYCTSLRRQSIESIQALIQSIGLAEPIAEVWITSDAARLPGLSQAIHQHMTERTTVRILPPEAIGTAAVHLGERFRAGELIRTHLDTLIPVRMAPLTPSEVKNAASVGKVRRS